ncbi:MAG: hypothetical protein IKF38_02010 [Clostridia bacterium]|nr:hypothetical protein [Clostridia bacterium]
MATFFKTFPKTFDKFASLIDNICSKKYYRKEWQTDYEGGTKNVRI